MTTCDRAVEGNRKLIRSNPGGINIEDLEPDIRIQNQIPQDQVPVCVRGRGRDSGPGPHAGNLQCPDSKLARSDWIKVDIEIPQHKILWLRVNGEINP